MGNFIVSRPFIYVLGTTIDPAQNNPNETTIYGGHNDSMNGTTGHGHTGAVGDGPKITAAGIDLSGPFTFTGNVTINADLTVNGNSIFNGLMDLYNGNDFRAFSDAGVTQKFILDGATGDITSSGSFTGVNATLSGALTVSTLTPGSVLFAGVGGLVSQDNANFFWDDTNNRLGLGTATPAVQFHVDNTISHMRVSGSTEAKIQIGGTGVGYSFQADGVSDLIINRESPSYGLDTPIVSISPDGDIESFSGELFLPYIDPPTAGGINANSSIKSFVDVNSTGTANASYNMSSTSKTGTGDYEVNWNVDFVQSPCVSISTVTILNRLASYTNLSLGAIRVVTQNASTSTFLDTRFALLANADQ